MTLNFRRMEPFGVEIDVDLSRPLDETGQTEFRELLFRHRLLLIRGQRLDSEAHARVVGYIGPILVETGDFRLISADGNLGRTALCFHSDLSFTSEPHTALSLHAVDVVDGETATLFADGVGAAEALPAALREQLEGRDALALISSVQTHRAVPYDAPAFLPQQSRPAIIPHPVTRRPILYITEMQTARIEGLSPEDSAALLRQLFDILYAPANVYRHDWRNGDLVIWDNLALQHARPDLSGATKRELLRATVAEKSIWELCPQLVEGDPRIEAWGRGEELVLD